MLFRFRPSFYRLGKRGPDKRRAMFQAFHPVLHLQCYTVLHLPLQICRPPAARSEPSPADPCVLHHPASLALWLQSTGRLAGEWREDTEGGGTLLLKPCLPGRGLVGLSPLLQVFLVPVWLPLLNVSARRGTGIPSGLVPAALLCPYLYTAPSPTPFPRPFEWAGSGCSPPRYHARYGPSGSLPGLPLCSLPALVTL